jgi:hypothetical protein
MNQKFQQGAFLQVQRALEILQLLPLVASFLQQGRLQPGLKKTQSFPLRHYCYLKMMKVVIVEVFDVFLPCKSLFWQLC